MTNEYMFIISCIKSIINSEPFTFDLNQKIDYNKVYGICVRHCISSIVFGAVKNFSDSVPENFFKRLCAANKIMIMSSVARNDSINQIDECLKQNNVDFVLLKGAVLQNIYPEKYMRYSTDTDILVRESDFKKTFHLMKNLSYTFDSQNDKHYVFLKKPYVCVEVHKKLMSDNNFFSKAFEQTERKNGGLYLKKEFEIVYLVCHMAENMKKTAGIGIHSITDIYLFLKAYGNELDRKLLEKYLRENGVYQFFTCITDLAETWFGTQCFDDFKLKLTDFIFEGERFGNEVNAASGNLNDKKPLLGQKISLLVSKIFLPYRDLKKIYPALGKAPFMLPFFWAMRITGIIFRPEHRAFKRAGNILSKTNKKSIEKTKDIFDHLGLQIKN